jgi:hypothetical protein
VLNVRRLLVLALVATGSMGQTPAPDQLSTARQLYNLQKYSEAIAAAIEARAVPASAQPAAVVLARAHFERFRQTLETADLDAARAALRSVTASRLGPRDRVEFLIALGQSLYFDEAYSLDDRYSAAAEQFEAALARADLLDEPSRDRLFEWWAGALDHQAQQGTESGRRPIYERILRRAEAEVGRDDGAASATYWLAAAARGVGDLPRAIGAAVAGWVRAGSLGARGEVMRAELDKLVTQVILPERARDLTAEGDARQTLAALELQWEQVKGKW